MSRGINKAVIVGTLGKDPDIKYADEWQRGRQCQRRHQ